MGELKIDQTSGNLDRYVDKIKSRLENIGYDFYCIGYYLWEVKHFNYYLEGGYKDIYEFSEKELNFKKSSTINFISLVDKYAAHDENSLYPKMFIDEKYKVFGYSQLIEMLSLSPNQIENINSDMTIKQIREKKKELKSNENTIIDVEFKQDQVDLVENQTVILVDPVPNDIENLKINYNVLLKETDILRSNFKIINDDNTKLMHENENLKKSNLYSKKNDSEKINISDVIVADPDPVQVVKDKVAIMEYLNERRIILRDLAKDQKKDSIDKVKYSAGEYEIELLIDFISKQDYDFFQD